MQRNLYNKVLLNNIPAEEITRFGTPGSIIFKKSLSFTHSIKEILFKLDI